MVRPFKDGVAAGQACPMVDVFAEIAAQLAELQAIKTGSAVNGERTPLLAITAA